MKNITNSTLSNISGGISCVCIRINERQAKMSLLDYFNLSLAECTSWCCSSLKGISFLYNNEKQGHTCTLAVPTINTDNSLTPIINTDDPFVKPNSLRSFSVNYKPSK